MNKMITTCARIKSCVKTSISVDSCNAIARSPIIGKESANYNNLAVWLKYGRIDYSTALYCAPKGSRSGVKSCINTSIRVKTDNAVTQYAIELIKISPDNYFPIRL